MGRKHSSIRQDLKFVQWGPTFQIMVIRGIGISIIISFLFLLALSQGGQLEGATSPMDYMAHFGQLMVLSLLAGVLVYPLGGLLSWYLASFYRQFPLLGFFSLIYLPFTMACMLGDPFVFLVRKIKPALVPVERYPFLNFVPIVFVLDPAYTDALQATNRV